MRDENCHFCSDVIIENEGRIRSFVNGEQVSFHVEPTNCYLEHLRGKPVNMGRFKMAVESNKFLTTIKEI